jgi:hypothetical protein
MGDMFAIINHEEGVEFSDTEAVLPLQFFGARRGKAENEPLRRLLGAVLVEAVRSFQNSAGAKRPARLRDFAEAKSWLFSSEDDGPFSFSAVCEALEIDSQALRRGLLRWEEKKLSGEKAPIIRRSASLTGWRMSPRTSRKLTRAS